MSKKGGYYCAFKNCRGLSRRDKRSFFRFPKDPERSKHWVRACDRNDLLEKTPIELFNSYRVCAKHFTDSMFLNDLRNRLQPNSVPMQLEPPEDADDTLDVQKKNDFSECPDPVAKILSNCTLQKISADEFFKATGIRINEPVSAIKATEEFIQNPNPSDHIYSSNKSTNITMNVTENILSCDIDVENPSNFSVDALSYQDLLNSLPMSLISAPSAESSSMETSELPFLISDKTVEVQKIPQVMLGEQDVTSTLSNISDTFEPLDIMDQTDLRILRGKTEQTTERHLLFLENKLEKTCQTDTNLLADKLEEYTQTESNFIRNEIENSTQTTTSYFKDKLNRKKLRKILQSKKNEIRELKYKIQQNFDSLRNNITLEQFELLTEKFFPKETSDFIKIQAQLFNDNANNRKYTLDFKKQCLTLFLAGPKTYKNLQKIFCLPGVHDLQTLKF